MYCKVLASSSLHGQQHHHKICVITLHISSHTHTFFLYKNEIIICNSDKFTQFNADTFFRYEVHACSKMYLKM